MNFSQWLQEEMQKNNLTEYRIAKLSGVHQTTIKNLLSGTKPQIGTEEKIKRAIERINAEKQKNPASKIGDGKSDTAKKIMNELEGMSETEMLLALDRIKKIKESRE